MYVLSIALNFLPAQHRYTQLPSGGEPALGVSYAMTEEYKLEHLQMSMEPKETLKQGESGGWGYWSLSSTLETHLVPAQCLRSTYPNTGHFCPWKWYSDCLDMASMEAFVINQKVSGFMLISRRFSYSTIFIQAHCQSSLLLAQWLCLFPTLVSLPTYLYDICAMHNNRSSFRNYPHPQKGSWNPFGESKIFTCDIFKIINDIEKFSSH